MRSPFRTQEIQTLAQAMEIAIANITATRSANTVRTYRSHARQLERDFGHRLLNSITTAELESWRCARLLDVKPATVNGALTFLSLTYGIAQKTGRVATNPVKGIQWIEPRNEVEQLVAHEQEAAMLDYLLEHWPQEPANSLIVQLGTLTGMRRQELFTLRRENVRLEQKVVDGEETFGSIRIPRPKGKKSSRWIPLCQESAEVLFSLMALSQGPYVVPQLWESANRASMASHWMRGRFKPAARAIGLPGLRFHDLRHTFATRAIEDGRASLHEVKELLGHEHIQTTLRYTSPTRRHLHSVVQRAASRRHRGGYSA